MADLRLAVFDFDYTLADSSDGVVDCVQTSQRQMGLAVSAPEPIRRTIGLSVPETLVRLNGEAERGRAEEFARRFLARADEVMVDNTHLFDGVPEMLARLADLNVKCAIATTKYRYRIEQIFTRDGLLDAVDLIVGAEDVVEHKPDPECLYKVMEHLQSSADETIYVGDSAPDAGAAQRAGVGFILVETGLAPPESLASYPHLARLAHVKDLPDWVAQQETG